MRDLAGKLGARLIALLVAAPIYLGRLTRRNR